MDTTPLFDRIRETKRKSSSLLENTLNKYYITNMPGHFRLSTYGGPPKILFLKNVPLKVKGFLSEQQVLF